MTMLSLFGQPFVMPDYSEWAMGSIYNLLAQEDSLLALENYLDSLEYQIADQLEELQEAGDSLQALGEICFALAAYNDNGSTYIPISSSCRHVNIYTGYSQWNSSSYPLRLPESGNYIGQSITALLMPYGNANRIVCVEAFDGESWQTLTTMIPATGGNRPSLSYNNWSEAMHPDINKKFIWNGSQWAVISGGVQQILPANE